MVEAYGLILYFSYIFYSTKCLILYTQSANKIRHKHNDEDKYYNMVYSTY